MPYPTRQEKRDNRRGAAVAVGALGVVVLCVVAGVVGLLLFVTSCSTTLTASDDMPAYDYAGPDGTLTGVPYELRNYVVEDHDTGVYYFLLQDPKTGDIALCPRLESDGRPWQKPTYEGGM